MPCKVNNKTNNLQAFLVNYKHTNINIQTGLYKL